MDDRILAALIDLAKISEANTNKIDKHTADINKLVTCIDSLNEACKNHQMAMCVMAAKIDAMRSAMIPSVN